MTDDDAITRRLNALMAEYQQQLPGRIAAIEALLVDARSRADNAAILADLVFSLHKLAGSGATFGYEQLTAVARKWEKSLQPAARNGVSLPPATLDSFRTMVAELQQAASSQKLD